MYSDDDTPKGWVAPFGHPRIKACSRLPMAFRSVPRPSSPPGAKASTECPYRAPCARQHSPRGQCRSPPCTGTIVDGARSRQSSVVSLQKDRQPRPISYSSARMAGARHSSLYSALIQTPLNTIASSGWTTLGATPCRATATIPSGQTNDPTTRRSFPAAIQTDASRQPNHNRVVLRAQRRTRTRFTPQKNTTARHSPSGNTAGPATPRSRRQTQTRRSRKPSHEDHASPAPI